MASSARPWTRRRTLAATATTMTTAQSVWSACPTRATPWSFPVAISASAIRVLRSSASRHVFFLPSPMSPSLSHLPPHHLGDRPTSAPSAVPHSTRSFVCGWRKKFAKVMRSCALLMVMSDRRPATSSFPSSMPCANRSRPQVDPCRHLACSRHHSQRRHPRQHTQMTTMHPTSRYGLLLGTNSPDSQTLIALACCATLPAGLWP